MDTLNTPVPPAAPEYYVMKDGNVLGPLGIEELQEAVTEERIALADFVQTGGLPTWRPVSQVLGLGEFTPGAVAPDWRSIFTWAWARLRFSLDEQSLATGLVFFGMALVTLFLSRFSFLMWVPWLILAAAAGIAMIRRRQALGGVTLLICVCLVPIAVAKYHFHSPSPVGDWPSLRARSENTDRLATIPPLSEPASTPQAALEESKPVEATPPLALNEAPDPSLPEPVAALIAETTPPPPVTAPLPVVPKPEPLPAATVSIPAPAVPPPIASAPSPATASPPPLPKAVPATASPATPPSLVSTPTKSPGTQAAPASGGGDLVQRHRDSLVVIKDRDGSGSGFLCKKGEKVWLFTNNHVAAGMKQPVFSRLDGSRITVGIPESAAGYDAMRFAVNESPAEPLESVADLQGIARIDDEVLVLGNSGGGGVVTSIPGKLVGIGPDRIEVSAEFIPGNSGSPIIHVPSGKVIGIATYLMRRYEEFSAGGEGPQAGSGAKPPGSGLLGKGTVVTRRFGYRVDNVPRWEPVNWQAFQSEAEQLRQISALTGDIFDFLGNLRRDQSPSFETDTLRRPAQTWFDTIRKPRLSEVDKTNATHSFLNSLRYMVRADVAAAEARFRYTYFRDRLKEERTVRDKLYQAFDSEARRLASPRAGKVRWVCYCTCRKA